MATLNNKSLINAKKQKDDEFYTSEADFWNVFGPFLPQMKNKVVLCNCDNPSTSNVFKLFLKHFDEFGLKDLFCIGYQEGIWTRSTGLIQKSGLGFDSKEGIELLKKCDVVATNAPFSNGLFQKWINLSVQYNKKFVGVGPKTAAMYKDLIQLTAEGKLDVCKSPMKKFIRPDGTTAEVPNYIFTNLEIPFERKEVQFHSELKVEDFQINEKDPGDNIIIPSINAIPLVSKGFILALPVSIFEYNWKKYFRILRSEDPIVNGKKLFKKVICQVI